MIICKSLLVTPLKCFCLYLKWEVCLTPHFVKITPQSWLHCNQRRYLSLERNSIGNDKSLKKPPAVAKTADTLHKLCTACLIARRELGILPAIFGIQLCIYVKRQKLLPSIILTLLCIKQTKTKTTRLTQILILLNFEGFFVRVFCVCKFMLFPTYLIVYIW